MMDILKFKRDEYDANNNNTKADDVVFDSNECMSYHTIMKLKL